MHHQWAKASRGRKRQQSKRDFFEPAGRHVEDEPTQRLVLGDERTDLDPAQGLTHILGQIAEGLGGPAWFEAGLVLDATLEVVVGECQHAAIGVVDEDDLLGAEQALADRQGPDLVIGDHPAGIADDVRLAVPEPQDAVDVQAGVHTREHRDMLARRQR